MCWMELVVQRAPEHSRVTREREAPASTEDLSERASNNVLNRPAPCPWESLSCVEIKVTIVITAPTFSRVLPESLYLFSSWFELTWNDQPAQARNSLDKSRSSDFGHLSWFRSKSCVWKSSVPLTDECVSEQISSNCSLSLEMCPKPQNTLFHQ